MAVAALALGGAAVSIYLTLYKMGVIGELACTVGHCETVNLSRWAVLFGLPVAAWGVGFYLLLFVAATAGVSERLANAFWVSKALVALTGWGVLFSLWLTYLELFVIHAVCVYCVTSAVIVTLAFIASLLDWREFKAQPV
jgi:uncharacterized membrane protein